MPAEDIWVRGTSSGRWAMVGAGRPSVSAPFTVGPGVRIPFAPAVSRLRTRILSAEHANVLAATRRARVTVPGTRPKGNSLCPRLLEIAAPRADSGQ
jgi:hypothetical protein